MKIYTIGFTQKSARQFFTLLKHNRVERLIDIRLHPAGQLAGFAKQDDLAYFLEQLAGCDYHHLPLLAPSGEILSDYRKDHNWSRYVERFEALMDQRNVPYVIDRQLFEEKVACLLCSEATPAQCHRRLVASRLAANWPNTEVIDLT